MICPHESDKHCAVLSTVGVTAIAGKSNPNYPCDRCRSEWTDGTPPDPADRSTWTPTLLSFLPDTGTPKPTGLGDTIANALASIGIRKRRGCGCTNRQATLNRWFPYRGRRVSH